MVGVTKKDNRWYLMEGIQASSCLFLHHWIGACWHTARIAGNVAIDEGWLKPQDTIPWNVTLCALEQITLRALWKRLFAEKGS